MDIIYLHLLPVEHFSEYFCTLTCDPISDYLFRFSGVELLGYGVGLFLLDMYYEIFSRNIPIWHTPKQYWMSWLLTIFKVNQSVSLVHLLFSDYRAIMYKLCHNLQSLENYLVIPLPTWGWEWASVFSLDVSLHSLRVCSLEGQVAWILCSCILVEAVSKFY